MRERTICRGRDRQFLVAVVEILLRIVHARVVHERLPQRGGGAVGADHNRCGDGEFAASGFVADGECSRVEIVAGAAVMEEDSRVRLSREFIEQLGVQTAAADGVNHFLRLYGHRE